MKKSTLILIIAILAQTFCMGQQLSSPESIAYYPAGDYYLVSNAGSGTIYKYTTSGEISNLFSGLLGPKGMIVINNTLFVADLTNLVAFNLTSNTKTFTRLIIGSAFLNDICTDGMDYIYLTDTQKNSIFKYSIPNQEITMLQLKSSLVAPNGIIFSNGKLLGVSMMAQSPMWQVDLSTNIVTIIKSTTFDYLDGIQSDGQGNIYISAWNNTSQSGAGAIYRIKDDFSGDFVKVADGFSGPADILFNNGKLFIPEMNANKITVLDLTSVRDEKKMINLPSDGLLRLPTDILPPYSLELYDLTGNVILSERTINSSYKLDFPTGIYFLRINGTSYGKIMITR